MKRPRITLFAAALGIVGFSSSYFLKPDSNKSKEQEIYDIDNLSYTEINSLGRALVSFARKNPKSMKTYIVDSGTLALEQGYEEDIFDGFSVKETADIFHSIVRSKAREKFQDSEKIAKDLVEKITETKFYDDYLKNSEERTTDAVERLRETELYERVANFGEGFYKNVRERLFNGN